MKIALKNAQCVSWVYLKYPMISCCYLINLIFSTLPGYRYHLRERGEADAISISSTISGEQPCIQQKAKGRGKTTFSSAMVLGQKWI